MALSVRLATIATFAIRSTAYAQAEIFRDSSRYSFSMSFGRFDYHLARVGEASMFAVRLERPTSKHTLAEIGISFAHPLDRSGERRTYWIPELQVQAQLPGRIVAPYVGVGGGIVWDPGRENTVTPQTIERAADPTFSTAAGVRAWFSQSFGARAELRARAIGGGEFSGGSVEWTAGAALRF